MTAILPHHNEMGYFCDFIIDKSQEVFSRYQIETYTADLYALSYMCLKYGQNQPKVKVNAIKNM